ncbi:MAG: MaoC family dehydratase [Terricaulis sp.]
MRQLDNPALGLYLLCQEHLMREIPLAEIPSLVGQEIGVSDWLEITQDRVNRFADATGDHQWIHVDIERATRELGSPIAHGFLVVSLIPFLAKNIIQYQGVGRGINYGSNKVRFTNVVPVGSRIRMRVKMLSCEMRGGAYQVINQCTIEVEGQERPACVAENISLLYPA